MKKLFVIAFLLAVAYLAAGVCAWRMLPAKIAEAERKRAGVTLACAKVADDQLAVSQRIAEITAQTLDRGRDKAEQVSMMLGDATLNRMALTYMGADWSVTRSGFVGNLKHMRDRQRAQNSDQKKREDQLEKKIEKIEYRKRQVLREMSAPHDSAHRHKEEQWKAELRDLDRQLAMLRDTSQYRDKLDKTGSSEAGAVAETDGKTAIFKLATDCEAQTVGRLVKALAEKSASLKSEESEVEKLKDRLSFFNVWPLNKLAGKPIGE